MSAGTFCPLTTGPRLLLCCAHEHAARVPGEQLPADDCTELRAAVDTRCASAHEAKAAHDAAERSPRACDVTWWRREHKQTEAARPTTPAARCREGRAPARRTSRRALRGRDRGRGARRHRDVGPGARSHQPQRRRRHRDAAKAETTVADPRGVNCARPIARSRQRSAPSRLEAACLDARVRLATCERGRQRPVRRGHGHGLRAARRHRRARDRRQRDAERRPRWSSSPWSVAIA